jgi:endonuclease III
LLEILESFYGFRDSPFYKKALLLAKILCLRPERFLKIKDKEHQKVILDYHLLRLAERTGMIDILDPNLTEKLMGRQWVSREEEYEVRQRALEAYDMICKISEKDPFTIDDLFWKGREYCHEMQEPECMKCLLNTKCKGSRDPHYKMLFQPVIRTVSY